MGKKKELSGWGGISKGVSTLLRPERIEALKGRESPFSVRGLGRSYGDASLNTGNDVILMERLNRFLEFNSSSGLLKVESGATIKEIVTTFVPKGFFVPVTPGTQEVTLGGCLAADVHGKNHHKDGSFAEHVLEFDLLLPNGLKKRVQPHDELFSATSGGMGLTGIITEMTLKLLPIETPFMKITHTSFHSLEKLLSHLSENKKRYSVAWLDLLSFSKSCRSVAMEGDHLLKEEGFKLKEREPPSSYSLPFTAPPFALNRVTQNLFNALYYRLKTLKKAPYIANLNSFFYPLDKIQNWNRLYGKRGFYQYQCVVPEKKSLKTFTSIFDLMKKKKCPVFLAILKKLGKENGGYLSFPKEGFTLAMDIPGNAHELFSLLHILDDMVMQAEGRVYLAKDGHLLPKNFRTMYPRYPLFHAVKNKIDPKHLMHTDLSRRLEMETA